jgi:RimJ/RimL family protein N-acetyltransferase
MYIADVLDFARSKFNPRVFRVTVAAFNERALRAWKKAGFQQVQAFLAQDDKEPFIILVRHI